MSDTVPQHATFPLIAYEDGHLILADHSDTLAAVPDDTISEDDRPVISERKHAMMRALVERSNALVNIPDPAATLAALRREAGVLLCLATSPRFQGMTVREALGELANNGCGHDGGTALAALGEG